MFIVGIQKLLNDGKIAEDFFTIVDENYGIDQGTLIVSDDGDVVVPTVANNLSEEQKEEIAYINPLSDSEIMGVDIYLSILEIINN